MRPAKILQSIAMLVAVFAARTGHAYTFVSNGGSACQPQTTDAITHSISGAVNPSTSSASVFNCPLGLGTQTANPAGHQAVVVRYKDFTSTDNFWCEVYQTFYDGSVAYSANRYTCSTAGGCTDPTTSYTGGGYLQWDYTALGSDLYNHYADSNYGVICGVPKSSGAASYIISYYSWN